MNGKVEIQLKQGARGRWRFRVVLVQDEQEEILTQSPIAGWVTREEARDAARRFTRLMRLRRRRQFLFLSKIRIITVAPTPYSEEEVNNG